MKKHYFFLISCLLLITSMQQVNSQNCTGGTPLFFVNLTGQPNGVWQSPPVNRGGDCCGTDVNCIEFIVTLDSMATGILFNIISGATPGGALYYQVNCGPLTSIGTPVCLNGPGPHDITFCKPGGNINVYQIASIPIPNVTGTDWVTQTCIGNMSIQGLDSTTTTWTSIPPNPLYNSYLSCMAGCNNVTVIPTGAFPPYIDYQVCGIPVGGCVVTPFCDTMRINFANSLAVGIIPQNPVICFGAPPAVVTANATGGLPPYNYNWSTGATSQSINVTPGTYYVTVTDSLNCYVVTDSVVVSGFSLPIGANAGLDQILCLNTPSAQLNGSITAATGGIWLGGNGTFNPNNTTLNAIYTPSIAEINSGSVQLMLVTTGNNTCPADTDYITISLVPNPSPQVIGNDTVCAQSSVNYSTSFTPGNTYLWSVTGGTIVSNNNVAITVLWGAAGNGSVTLTVTNPLQCDSTVSAGIVIAPQPAPVINGPLTTCTTTNTSYSITFIVPGNTYSWNVIGGTIIGPANGSTINVLWITPGIATVSVNEANNMGCDSLRSVTVTVLTQPAPVLAGSDTICEMQTAVYTTPYVAGHTYSWNVTGGTILNTNINSITVQWPAITNGMVSVTQSNTLACDSTVSLVIAVAPQPAPVITGPGTNCTTYSSTYSVALPVPGNTYAWTVTGGTIIGPSNGTSATIFWNTPGTATISVTESNSYGCDSTTQVSATTLTIPAPSIAGPDTVCAMQTITYSTPFVAGNTYNWNVAGGTVMNVNNNIITIQWPANGMGSVSVTEANSATCDSTVVNSVIIAPQPAPVISGSLTTCTTTMTTYSALSPVPGNMYAWTVTGGMITGPSNGTSVNIQWTNPGTATITLTESNSLGCDSTISVTANVLSQPTPVIAGPDTVCALHTITYSTPLVPGNTYLWNVTGGTVMSINNNSITIDWTANGTGSVSVTESNSSSCVATASTNIVIAPQPVPVINGTLTSCTATNSQFNALNTIVGNIYQWSITGGGTITGATNGLTVNIYWTNAGPATLSFTETNNWGCDSTVSVVINVLQRPDPAFSGPPVVCEETQSTYTVNNYIPAHNYIWSVVNGTIIGLNVGSSIEVLWSNAGNGRVTLRQISTNGCDSITDENIIINPLPAPAISGPSVICENETAIYTTPASFGNTYAWTTTGGIINTNPTLSQISVSWSSGPAANVYLTETTSNGCLRYVQLPVQILAKPKPAIQGNTLGCIGAGNYNYSTVPQSGTTYQWSVSGGAIASGNGTANIYVQWQLAGMQIITLTAVNTTTGCDSIVTYQVQTGSMPAPVIQAPSLSGCAPVVVSFAGNVQNPNYQYLWNFGDGTTQSGPNPSHEFDDEGTYMIQLIASNNTGCADTVSALVNVYPVPHASFALYHGSGTYYANISQMTLNNLSSGATTYQWTFGDGYSSTDFEPIHQFTEPGNYTITLIAANQYGCIDSARTRLEVRMPEGVYVPNAFTPNGDSNNDNFSVAAYNIDEFHIDIFNRWGKIIYSSKDPFFQWDGSYNGIPVANGVYVYSLKAIGIYGTDFNYSGTVTVVK